MALSGAEKARRYRLRRKGVRIAPLPTGRPVGRHRQYVSVLDVTCWCEAEIVRVSRRDVLAGVTRSCGSPRCREAA